MQARYSLLEVAAQRGSVGCLEYLVQSGGVNPLDHRDINERNILHKLCILGEKGTKELDEKTANVIRKLLELLPDLAKQGDFAGRRPMHYACEFGQAGLVRLLLEHAVEHGYYGPDGFADPSWQDREGHTPFFLAILHGNYETLDMAINIGSITDIDHVVTGR